MTFGWPWQITTKRVSYIPLGMIITWLEYGGILVETRFLSNFLPQFLLCFFMVKHSIGYISGMVGPIDVKRKGGASVGYLVNYVTLTFYLTHDLDLWFFKVKFQNSCIWGIVFWLMWNIKNQILGWLYGLAHWPHPWPWPCSLKVKVWNSLIWGMGVGALIDMERKSCESISHDHDCDLWVTMVGWVDVPYSDWCDFRRRRAVDISSLLFGYIIHIFILFIYFM